MNAFTAKEYTCYYARVLDTDLPLAADVVCDMVTASRIATADVESERGVILEEIAMHDDDPGDVVHDAFAAALFGDGPLGRPVIGTVESVEGLSRAAAQGLVGAPLRAPERRRRGGRRARPRRGRRPRRAGLRAGAATATRAPVRPSTPAAPTQAGVVCERRPSEQANLVLGVPGLARDDERRFALEVLSGGLGGGHEQPAVPGGPRGAGPGLLRLQLRLRPRRHRRWSASTPAAPPAGPARWWRCAARCWPASPRTG